MNHLPEVVISLSMLAIILRQLGRLRRDAFRSDIRAIRDDLFDFMWRNGYSHQDPGYLDSRRIMNGILRLSNTFSFGCLFVSMYYYRMKTQYGYRQAVRRVSVIPPLELRISEAEKEVTERVLQFLFFEGARRYVVKILVVFAKALLLYPRLVRLAHKQVCGVVAEAYAFGAPTISQPMKNLLRTA